MQRPFEGIRVIDATHVLAGPYSAYQLAILGADVIRVERPDEPDQGRLTGGDVAGNLRGMGTQYLAQGANKRSITLNLKKPEARDILKRLVATADVFIENFRPGAFESIGLGADDLRALNPRLIYCSISAYGQAGPRGTHTAYDSVIQATSGLMAMTGTPATTPVKLGAPVIDYATGNNAAFAIASALFQRERTGSGQRIDVAMLDTALILASSVLVNYGRTGREPKPIGNDHAYFATSSCYRTRDGDVMLGAGNLRQQKRLWLLLGHPGMVKKTNEERVAGRAAEAALLAEIMLTRTADEWQELLPAHQIPAAKVRSLAEAVADPHLAERGLFKRYEGIPGVEGPFLLPVAAFRYAQAGPAIDSPPPLMGAHNAEILGELGFSTAEQDKLRVEGVV